MTSGDRKMRRVQRQCGKKIINAQNGMNSRLLSEKIASTAYRSRVRRARSTTADATTPAAAKSAKSVPSVKASGETTG
jgi:hypothetical protein